MGDPRPSMVFAYMYSSRGQAGQSEKPNNALFVDMEQIDHDKDVDCMSLK